MSLPKLAAHTQPQMDPWDLEFVEFVDGSNGFPLSTDAQKLTDCLARAVNFDQRGCALLSLCSTDQAMLQRLVKLKGPSNLYQLLKVWLEAGLSDSTTKPVPQPLSESIRRILQLLTILPVDLEAIKTSYIGHFVRLIKEGKSASLVARDSDVIAKASVVYDKWKRASDSARAASGAASVSSTASAKKAGSKRTASDKGDIEIVESDDDEKRALKRAKKDKKDKKERQDEPGQSKTKKDSSGSTSSSGDFNAAFPPFSSLSALQPLPPLQAMGAGGSSSGSALDSAMSFDSVDFNSFSSVFSGSRSGTPGGQLGGARRSGTPSHAAGSSAEGDSIEVEDDQADLASLAGVADEEEYSAGFEKGLVVACGYGEEGTEPGLDEPELKALPRVRGLGVPERYGAVQGGILVNKVLKRVGGKDLSGDGAEDVAGSPSKSATQPQAEQPGAVPRSKRAKGGIRWVDGGAEPASSTSASGGGGGGGVSLSSHPAKATPDELDKQGLVAVKWFYKTEIPAKISNPNAVPSAVMHRSSAATTADKEEAEGTGAGGASDGSGGAGGGADGKSESFAQAAAADKKTENVRGLLKRASSTGGAASAAISAAVAQSLAATSPFPMQPAPMYSGRGAWASTDKRVQAPTVELAGKAGALRISNTEESLRLDRLLRGVARAVYPALDLIPPQPPSADPAQHPVKTTVDASSVRTYTAVPNPSAIAQATPLSSALGGGSMPPRMPMQQQPGGGMPAPMPMPMTMQPMSGPMGPMAMSGHGQGPAGMPGMAPQPMPAPGRGMPFPFPPQGMQGPQPLAAPGTGMGMGMPQQPPPLPGMGGQQGMGTGMPPMPGQQGSGAGGLSALDMVSAALAQAGSRPGGGGQGGQGGGMQSMGMGMGAMAMSGGMQYPPPLPRGPGMGGMQGGMGMGMSMGNAQGGMMGQGMGMGMGMAGGMQGMPPPLPTMQGMPPMQGAPRPVPPLPGMPTQQQGMGMGQGSQGVLSLAMQALNGSLQGQQQPGAGQGPNIDPATGISRDPVPPLFDKDGNRIYAAGSYPPSCVPTAGSRGGANGRKATRPCMFFNTQVGCKSGEKCGYIHDHEFKATQAQLDAISRPGLSSGPAGAAGVTGAMSAGTAQMMMRNPAPQQQQQQQQPGMMPPGQQPQGMPFFGGQAMSQQHQQHQQQHGGMPMPMGMGGQQQGMGMGMPQMGMPPMGMGMNMGGSMPNMSQGGGMGMGMGMGMGGGPQGGMQAMGGGQMPQMQMGMPPMGQGMGMGGMQQGQGQQGGMPPMGGLMQQRAGPY